MHRARSPPRALSRRYLTLGHDPTTVGVLLGMAAARAGSADDKDGREANVRLARATTPKSSDDDVVAFEMTSRARRPGATQARAVPEHGMRAGWPEYRRLPDSGHKLLRALWDFKAMVQFTRGPARLVSGASRGPPG